MREAVASIVRHIMGDEGIEIVETAGWFETGLLLFESRPDKGYSMTDCMSMLIMRGFDAAEVLTHDHHFAQEGFIILL
jgi:predicted nucleic acid-binding protein